MLLSALEVLDPVIVFEHAMLFNQEDHVSEDIRATDIDHAKVRCSGSDVSSTTYGGSVPKCMQAAHASAVDGIKAEVLDLRTLPPLDTKSIIATVTKTRRGIVVDEGWRTGSLSAKIMARIMEQAFYELEAPIERVCSAEVPVPYPKHLEDAALPQVDKIVSATKKLVGKHV